MRDNPRTTVVSALVGALLLGGVFVFTVLVPELGDDQEVTATDATGQTPIELPDQLTDNFVAIDLGTLPAELISQFGDLDALLEQEAAIADGLQGVFGVPGAFRVYAAADGSALAQVTVLDKAPGLFTPDALPIDPAALGVTRAPSELLEVDGAVCSVDWGAEVATGAQVPPTDPQAVRCQYGVGERTYELTAQAVGIDEAVTILQDLASA